ncbi:MAG TPA: DUF1592 domain-containing protein [Polyangiaceae bacterium LLY-WYZ-15_(1-7)]|nr:DUF1592 domain-containing protein [Polyangiaceae bacterium LLY-WYZ-15_(1-7)]HJL06744.1 DUF1592 domain-containing protein [Polyangiaceae bacterium LLY-WYZ-15_(1-7)]HJL09105.1 DUF1592 domain-containing protein [Polyangiaceae bacterium LLY-WYZ-15_(1-7)]HJL30033.1 DUF1592 domain-containing protein [Polyangiaceae bacterium LLY-WYZ-15_(1-7)]
MLRRLPLFLAALLLTACQGEIGNPTGTPSNPTGPTDPTDPIEPPPFAPAPATLHRLTRVEYERTLTDLLPAGVPLPTDLEVDTPLHGFTTIGGSELTIPPRAAEQYEAAAREVADAIFDDPTRRAAFLGCEPTSATDPCLRAWLTSFGRRAWRRPLEPAELDALSTLVADLAERFGAPHEGARWALVAMLQAPDFLFRVEVGELDPSDPTRRRYTSWEMASRLSYLVWSSTPDDALLDAAARGELVTDEGLERQLDRLLADPRADAALARFFGEFASLERLETVSKDPELYPELTPSLRASMRRELELLFAEIASDPDADFRALFDTNVTYVDSELAALYGLPDPGEGVHRTTLPEGAGRGGLMGRAGILSLWAHATLTSPTLRGRFVRASLLCEDIPPPPPGVDTTLEHDPEAGPQTMRERLEEHRSNPVCAGCHDEMDPIGFALERFGPLGEWRETDEGLPIDTATELDGAPIDGAAELGDVLATDDRVAACVARRLFRYGTGHLELESEEAAVRALGEGFADRGYVFRELLRELVLSDAFRTAALREDDAGACSPGDREACSTSCGEGTRSCGASGVWGPCSAATPTPESCNGADDDCDGATDEDLVRTCDDACGGTQSCSGGAWGACEADPSAETCDGTDDDCDGAVDEGMGRRPVETSFTLLAARHPGCDGASQRRGTDCNAAIHRLCAATGCNGSGFGPVAVAGDAATVACVDAGPIGTTYTALRGHHPSCDGVERMGPNCNAAIHRFCQSRGAASGFGPVEHSGDGASIVCVDDAEVRVLTYGDLTPHQASCHSGTRIGPECDAAIHRYCVAEGFATGFGPVENSGETAVVTCLRRTP